MAARHADGPGGGDHGDQNHGSWSQSGGQVTSTISSKGRKIYIYLNPCDT